MSTVGVIRNGETYLTRHLRKNDYWAEGEAEVQGEWIGEGAARLGLHGAVTDEPFESLRANRHPRTGESLTARDLPGRVAFFDIQLSAPKDVSVLAILGGDERVTRAFRESVHVALKEMERFAAVRERRGEAAGTEAFRLTQNVVGGLFFHDASRDLDPQLHAHAVLANATWDAQRGEWLALQPAEMLRASAYVRQVLYRELAGRLRTLGYDPYEMNSKRFAVRGVEHLRERYSKRTRQVQVLAEAFAAEKGRKPTKREIEVLVRESRADKLTEIATEDVRRRQREELKPDEAQRLDGLVAGARSREVRPIISHGVATEVLEAGFRHVYERNSVAREGAVLGAALEVHPDFFGWRELRGALDVHPQALRKEAEMTLLAIHREEHATIDRSRAGRNQRFPLGRADDLPVSLTPGQSAAATAILTSRDFVTVLVGDAGTGKTTVLTAIERAHVAVRGEGFVTLAPTTKARDALVESGFAQADTVQCFLVSDVMQVQATGRVVLVDEAGLLSTQQLDHHTSGRAGGAGTAPPRRRHQTAHERPAGRRLAQCDPELRHARGPADRGSATTQRSGPPLQPVARFGRDGRGFRVCGPPGTAARSGERRGPVRARGRALCDESNEGRGDARRDSVLGRDRPFQRPSPSGPASERTLRRSRGCPPSRQAAHVDKRAEAALGSVPGGRPPALRPRHPLLPSRRGRRGRGDSAGRPSRSRFLEARDQDRAAPSRDVRSGARSDAGRLGWRSSAPART